MNDYWKHLKLFHRNVVFLITASAVHGFVFFGIYSLLLNLFLLRLEYGPEFIGLVNGIGPLMLAICSLPAGIVSRRFGSRPVLLGGYIVTALSLLALPLATAVSGLSQQVWIAGAYALGWGAGAFLIVNFSPYLMAWTGEEERNYAFAIQSSTFPLAGFLGSFLGGTLPSLFARIGDLTLDSPMPYRNALIVAAVIDLLAAAVIWQTTSDVQTAVFKPDLQNLSHSVKSPSRPPYRTFALFTAVSLLTIMAEWSIRVYFNVYLDSVFLVPTSLIGVLSAGALFMGLFALMSPKASAKWGRKSVIVLGLIGVSFAFVPILFISHWVAVGLGYMILIGSVSLNNPTFLVLSQSEVNPEWRTLMASCVSMSIGVGVAITSFGGGFVVAQFGFRTLFILGASAALIGVLVAWQFFPEEETAVAVAPVASD